MNYFISREGQQYGPYTLADLQRYVASGDVLTSDLATSEGMAEPATVGQIIGNIVAPVAYPPQYPGGGQAPAAMIYPDPPNLHWGLVLLFAFLTCGLFVMVWDLVLSSWMKKVDPRSQSLYYYIGGVITLVGYYAARYGGGPSALSGVLYLVCIVLLLVGRFRLKASLEDHYSVAEQMGLSLSGVMTFFFGCIYFQYHINDIMKRKMMDRMYGAR